jgi:hypothetical protein
MAWSHVAQTRRYKKHQRTVIHNSRLAICKGPSNKFAQQRVVQQETVSIHDTISLRKLQSLGKCQRKHAQSVPFWQLFLIMRRRKTPYTGRRKGVFGRKIGSKEASVTIFFICSCIWHFEKKMRTVWESMIDWWRGTKARKHAHTRFKILHNSNHTRSSSLRNSRVWGP